MCVCMCIMCMYVIMCMCIDAMIDLIACTCPPDGEHRVQRGEGVAGEKGSADTQVHVLRARRAHEGRCVCV